MNEEILKYLELILGSSVLSTIIIVVYLFNRPDKFEHWMKIFYQCIYYLVQSLPKIKRKIDQKLVAASIQDTVNQICDQINTESPNILPHALKIEWIKSESPESFISKGKTIVRLKNYENQDRNIVDSTLLYIKIGFLPRAKNYLDKSMRQSCEYKIASRILITRRDTGAYDYFYSNEMEPSVLADSQIEKDLQLLESLDAVGYFTRIFLTETFVVSQKLLGTAPTEVVRRELRDFAKFLCTIAQKAKDENVQLSFMGSKIKTSIILVAKNETINQFGVKPYLNRVKRCLKEGYESIYLTGWGKIFVSAIVQLKNEIEPQILTFARRYDYPVFGTTKAILIVCQPKSSYLAKQKRLHGEVQQVFEKNIPEIKEGLIQIASIARIENVGFKVAVRCIEEKNINPAGCCIGIGGERIKKIKECIPEEFISVTTWSDNIKESIIRSLSPLNQRYIENVNIDEENLIVDVFVKTRDAAGKAVGKGGCNVRLASEMTGYLINIQAVPTQEPVSPEEELRQVLSREVPEILNNEI
ncbi:hypothetical protein KJ766_02750, partial [Patescibacteria group bacterium]|nr:hypothetical protein [Patescibacteria group bacterium]